MKRQSPSRTQLPRIAVALIGYGHAGRVFHAPIIRSLPGFALQAIVTANPGRMQQVRDEVPEARTFPTVESLLDGDIHFDLAVIATPSGTHMQLALQCISHHLHVVVDKPFALARSDAESVIEAAQQKGVLLSVFQNRRWDGDFLTVQSLLDHDILGHVHRFESRFERWRPIPRTASWREKPGNDAGGGLLYDLGPHLIDQALMLFGPVASVYAELDSRRPKSRVDDDDFIALTHAGGVRSHLSMSQLSALPGIRFRMEGEARALEISGLDPQEEQLLAGLRPGNVSWGTSPPERVVTLGTRSDATAMDIQNGSYETFYLRMYDAIMHSASVPVNPEDSLNVLDIIAACQRSAAEHTAILLGESPPATLS